MNDLQSALDPPVGFQSDWTDPTTDDVWMGARWYGPDIATFLSRDDIPDLLKTPITLNRYTYAIDDPLDYFDPDGRCPVCYALGQVAQHAQATSNPALFDTFVNTANKVHNEAEMRRIAAQRKAVEHYLQVANFLGCAPGVNCPGDSPGGVMKPRDKGKAAPKKSAGANRKPGRRGQGKRSAVGGLLGAFQLGGYREKGCDGSGTA